jgi:hypothetical protein
MPRKSNAQGETFDRWRHLIKALLANIGELPHLEAPRAKLEAMFFLALELVSEQRTFSARRQEASRKLQELLMEGRRLADFLQTGIREHYGTRAEKLSEFGLPPFRGRKPSKPPEVEETPAPTVSPAAAKPNIP